MANHILWIDDEIYTVRPSIDFLKSQGYECDSVSSNDDALELLLGGTAYDLIVQDIMRLSEERLTLEETDGGFRTSIAFYGGDIQELSPDTPVLFVTAMVDASVHDRLLRSSNCRIPTKPFRFDELGNAI